MQMFRELEAFITLSAGLIETCSRGNLDEKIDHDILAEFAECKFDNVAYRKALVLGWCPI